MFKLYSCAVEERMNKNCGVNSISPLSKPQKRFRFHSENKLFHRERHRYIGGNYCIEVKSRQDIVVRTNRHFCADWSQKAFKQP
jgi:hypothetical protein